MIIETRYRDITADDFLKCTDPVYHANLNREMWEKRRGSPVRIFTPPQSSPQPSAMICTGPFYENADHPGFYLCPHIAEIGD